MSEPTIAMRIFDAETASSELEERLEEAGMKFSHFGWDSYDWSLEIGNVPADYRATEDVQRILYEAGFSVVYVNHVDGWETHYRFSPSAKFAIQDGWRVSYPHKRPGGTGKTLVEKPVPGWSDDGSWEVVP